MTTQAKTRTWARIAFLLLGCGLGAGYVLTGRVPQPDRQLPARASISWARSGDLVVTPQRQRLAAGNLEPGQGTVAAAMTLRNPTAVALAARPRALGRPGALDDLVVVKITSAGVPLFEGPLRLLRTLHAQPLTVASRARAAVRISARLPGPAPAREWTDRRAPIRLEWRTAPAKGGER